MFHSFATGHSRSRPDVLWCGPTSLALPRVWLLARVLQVCIGFLMGFIGGCTSKLAFGVDNS